MKAEISAEGRFTISAETELESFALRRWLDINENEEGRIVTGNLLFRVALERPDTERCDVICKVNTGPAINKHECLGRVLDDRN